MAQTVGNVTFLDELVVVGPSAAALEHAHAELVRRVRIWQSIGPAPEPAEPSWSRTLDTVARRVLRDFRRSATVDEAMVLDRVRGNAWRFRVAGSGRPVWSGIKALTDNLAFGRLDAAKMLVDAAPLLTPWFGLLPVAKAQLDATGSALGDEGGLQVVLDGLRALGTEPYQEGQGPPLRGAVSAAGVTETWWLLDGAMNLLARRALDAGESSRVGAVTYRDGLFVDPQDDMWAFHPSGEASRSLASAPVGVCASTDADTCTNPGSGTSTGALGQPVPSGLAARLAGRPAEVVAEEVLAFLMAGGIRVLGIRILSDPLLGAQALAWGPVWLSEPGQRGDRPAG
jgi:hypothetical protein